MAYILDISQVKDSQIEKIAQKTAKTSKIKDFAILHICKYGKNKAQRVIFYYCGIVKIVASSETQYFYRH